MISLNVFGSPRQKVFSRGFAEGFWSYGNQNPSAIGEAARDQPRTAATA
jgi:hypothetical protein